MGSGTGGGSGGGGATSPAPPPPPAPSGGGGSGGGGRSQLPPGLYKSMLANLQDALGGLVESLFKLIFGLRADGAVKDSSVENLTSSL